MIDVFFTYTIIVALLFFLIIFFYRYIQEYLDIKKCKKIIQKNSLTFYKAFSKIPNKRKKNAIYAVYAFCRYADDIVDDKKNEKELLKLESELKMFVEGKTIPHFRWRALRKATRFYYKDFDYKPFFEMIEGQKRDLYHKDYKTLSELLDYCYLVAGTVGLMLLPILAPKKEEKLRNFAICLGHAMQLTNILRDVGEDYKNDRIYIPQDILKKHNFSHQDFVSAKNDSRFKKIFEEIAQVAEKYYNDSLSHIHLFPKQSQAPIAFSIILYKAIIDACRENNYDVFSRKNYVSQKKKKELIKKYLQSLKNKNF
ncbi:MAG: phytoene/squalene synthase family protein [Candidatus Moraniibacteriota bacterium]|nr:MAG: phytoene/squalene synthase family protein [Candidatus Moranbacteria bacterium]